MKKTSALFCLIVLLLIVFSSSVASDSRGLSVVSKNASGNLERVKLYNKTFAVIIGIDRYKNLPPDRQLKNAVSDAKAVEGVLRHNYRFDKIVTLYNEQATRENIMKTLTSDIAQEAGEDDSLFIFWAGHGNQQKSRMGEVGYLIPYDGSANKIYRDVSMADIRDVISKTVPAKHIFYVMDACYSGLLADTRGIDTKPKRDLNYLESITKESVRQVLTAGSKDQESLDNGPGGHSVFTGRLIEALKTPGDYVTANEIQAMIREKVYQDARARNHEQTPRFGVLYGTGDYVFISATGQEVIEQKDSDNQAELGGMQNEYDEMNTNTESASFTSPTLGAEFVLFLPGHS
jgi:uncharacterized caspase-like protein